MPVKLIPLTCPSCGGQLEIPDELRDFYCQYCGTAIKAVGAEGSVAQAADAAEAAQAQAAAEAQEEFLAGQDIPRPENGDGYNAPDTPDNGGM